ncbi:hypothetical protein OWI79_03580 [Mammaliicoccus sciuri]|nr:hypothetical protein [Mammaliicoccus sciuri]MCY1024772.1 hypothetical protein [Mammaliicoccus sciuri]MCY1051676.1 hypothetical protein [Mammaliicoccus sciuri]
MSGGTIGIGQSMALALTQAGVQIIIADLTPHQLKKHSQELNRVKTLKQLH